MADKHPMGLVVFQFYGKVGTEKTKSQGEFLCTWQMRWSLQLWYDVSARRAVRWASEQKFCEAEASRKFQNPSYMAHKGNHICLYRFSFIYAVNDL